MTLDTEGKLGIGITNPQTRLHIFNGSSNIAPQLSSTIITESSSDNFINILASGAHTTGVFFGANGKPQDGGIVYNVSGVPSGLVFLTNNSTRMALTSSGFLGVGTTTPKAPLHILKGGAANAIPNPNAKLVVESNESNFINILTPGTTNSGVLFGNNFNSSDGGIIYNSETTPRGLQFNTGGNSTRMVVASNGFVGLGTRTPASELHIVHSNNNNKAIGTAGEWTGS